VSGARPSGTGSRASTEPASRLGPPGFDPARGEFTPGPWKVRGPGHVTILAKKRHTHFDGTFTDYDGEVARVQPSPQRAANARLIAACPDLYETLAAVRAALAKVVP
jgi:hypothetical protein